MIERFLKVILSERQFFLSHKAFDMGYGFFFKNLNSKLHKPTFFYQVPHAMEM